MADVARADAAPEGTAAGGVTQDAAQARSERWATSWQEPSAEERSGLQDVRRIYEAARSRARITTAGRAERLVAGMVVGKLADTPVIAARVFAVEAAHDAALDAARAASRSLDGEPVAVLRRTEWIPTGGAPEVRFTVLEARLAPGARRPSMDRVLACRVREQREEQLRVTDIVFGDVSMVVPGSMNVSPWLYLLD